MRRHDATALGVAVVDITVYPADKNVFERDNTPVEQIIIKLFYFRDMDHEEIADVTGVSQNSVSPMLTRAREKLRDILERGGYKMEDFLYK